MIKLYMFDIPSNSLLLVHAYGSEEESKNILNIGEGVIGLAAENKMLVLRTSQIYEPFQFSMAPLEPLPKED